LHVVYHLVNRKTPDWQQKPILARGK
jgi:hypothetical protein